VVREVGGAGEVDAEIGGRPDHGVELEERPLLLEGAFQVRRVVARAEPAPEHEVGAGRDRGGRVDLQERQALDDGQQVGRPRCVEQLRADGDPARLLLRQPVHAGEVNVADVARLLGKLLARLRRNDPERAQRLEEQTRLRLEREGRGLPGADTRGGGPPPGSFGGGG
jgi:hypothetical protein